MRIKRQDIIDACGLRPFSAGVDYFRKSRVLSLEATEASPDEELRLRGQTKGSGRHVYTQDVVLLLDQDFVDIEGYCSCPMHYNCKHVAAVCVFYQENYKQSLRTAKSLTSSNTTEKKEQLDEGITSWLNKLASEANGEDKQSVNKQADYPVYVLQQRKMTGDRRLPDVEVCIRLTRPRKNGQGLVKGRAVNPEQLCSRYYTHGGSILPMDHDIGRILTTLQNKHFYYQNETCLEGRTGAMALSLMLESGRCYWESTSSTPLSAGEPRPFGVTWVSREDGSLSLHAQGVETMTFITVEPPMYVDRESKQIGPLEAGGWNGQQLRALLIAPIVPSQQAKMLTSMLIDQFPQLPLPPPSPIKIRQNNGGVVRPCLTLSRTRVESAQTHCLLLEFDYDGDRISPLPFETETRLRVNDEWVQVNRNAEFEQGAMATLEGLGFSLFSANSGYRQPARFIADLDGSVIDSAGIWAMFIEEREQKLLDAGWSVERDNQFQLQFEDADWEVPVYEEEKNGNDWFSLRFDLTVNNERLPLGPLLAPVLQMDMDALPLTLTLPLGEDRYVRLPTERIRPFLTVLVELFNRLPTGDDGKFMLSRFDAMAIDDLGEHVRGGEKLAKLAKRLKNFDGIQTVAIPEGFHSQLRSYQQTGLNWLQFLREYQFNGVLADDMGLGKTIQTLVHLLVEKRAGRLTSPALVIAPTSLMGNWRREIERFTPDLSVIVLHGSDRHDLFNKMNDHDIVLSTYPLLTRDSEYLVDTNYHSLILDEAQVVKNPRTKMARLVRQIKADHKICLSGTPLENHLGELWALFDFLMPGFLGSSDQFSRYFRSPIEKYGNNERRENLAKRIQPFLLRRTKSEVATELPPKTVIQRNVELSAEQAELYESIRVSMDKRVRQAIASQGLARSHITILDALLKLRQVCCDPRLLPLQHASKIAHSAKLELLMNLVSEQIDSGRRILVFSQFTSMLELIEQELKAIGIRYAKLTGKTRKRDEEIQRFQQGEVNLFLISLKAGGTGLNLTEADTVIIYDPWWNPAVESQAVDRAHRIGQDKPVFIYKLVVENSVEEKMVAMQARKRELAEGIYSQEKKDSALLDEHSLKELFAPLSEER